MTSSWQELLSIARSMIDKVNAEHQIIDRWTLGGGTAMMLQIDHRDSHDIDIFLDDHQLLGYLDPSRQDFDFVIALSTYQGDGTGFQKLIFNGVGEIDFIVATPLTEYPASEVTIDGRACLLETIEEIVTKKVFYRAVNLLPRDVFDIAAATVEHRDAVINGLAGYEAKVQRALMQIESSERDYIDSAIADLRISRGFDHLKRQAVDITTRVLREALSKARSTPESET
jgi:hypothetical protein